MGFSLEANAQIALINSIEYDMGYQLGLQAGVWANRHLPAGRTLKLGLLGYSQVLAHIAEREQGILEGLKEIFSGQVDLVVSGTGGSLPQGSATAERWLTQHPELDMILSINDAGAMGALQAASATGRIDREKFFIGGIDATTEAMLAIKSGGVYQATVTNPPSHMAIFAVRTLVRAFKGLPYEGHIQLKHLPVNLSNIDQYLGADGHSLLAEIPDDPELDGLDLTGIKIGIAVQNTGNPFFDELATVVTRQAARFGMHVIVSNARPLQGLLDIHSDEVDALTDEDRLVIEGVANQVAVAIENNRLLEEANIFRQFADTAGQGLSMATLDGKMVYMNPAMLRLVGEPSLEAVRGGLMLKYYHPQSRETIVQEVLPILFETGQWIGENTYYPVEGAVKPVIENLFMIKDEQGTPRYIAHAVTDISDRKLAEAELEARLKELNALQRLTSRQGWQEYQTVQAEQAMGYLFKDHNVQPVHELPAADAGNGRSVTVPMAVHGEAIGQLGLYQDDSRPLDLDEREFLDAVAGQVAEALERARLLEQTHKRAVELEAVAQVGTVAAMALELTELLQTVVDLTKNSFGLYHAHIYQLNSSGDMLNLGPGPERLAAKWLARLADSSGSA